MTKVNAQTEEDEKVEILEKHHHNQERWFAAAASASGEDHVADSITDNQTAFQADAGNDTWGTWLQIMGATDTPVKTNSVNYDFHRLLIVSHEINTTPYYMQIAGGDDPDASVAADNFTEVTLVTGAGSTEVGPVDILSDRIVAGVKCWVRIFAPGRNTATLDFLVGMHEYAI